MSEVIKAIRRVKCILKNYFYSYTLGAGISMRLEGLICNFFEKDR